MENNVQELLHRAPGSSTKMTTVTASTPGSKTITKTVITEKEERFEKKEIISYSGNAEFMDGVEEGRIGGELTGHHRSRSPFKTAQSSTRKESSSSPTKVSSSSTRVANSGSPAKVLSPLKDDYQSGRKARLANLASKFKQHDDEEEEIFKEEVVYSSLVSICAICISNTRTIILATFKLGEASSKSREAPCASSKPDEACAGEDGPSAAATIPEPNQGSKPHAVCLAQSWKPRQIGKRCTSLPSEVFYGIDPNWWVQVDLGEQSNSDDAHHLDLISDQEHHPHRIQSNLPDETRTNFSLGVSFKGRG